MATAAQARGVEGLNSRAIWFGHADRPLFGWLHYPAEVSAGVVLCRPIGLEALSAAPGRTDALRKGCLNVAS